MAQPVVSLTCTMPADQANEIEAVAKALGRSRAQLLRHLIEYAMKAKAWQEPFSPRR